MAVRITTRPRRIRNSFDTVEATTSWTRQGLWTVFLAILTLQWGIFFVVVQVESPNPLTVKSARQLMMLAKTSSSERVSTILSEEPCLTDDCLSQSAEALARNFPNRTNGGWCLAKKHQRDTQRPWQGLLFVKVPRAASSTAAAVSLRISKQHKMCQTVEWKQASAQSFQNRSKTRSFLWTVVRDPADRAMSSIFFYDISRRRPKQKYNVSNVDFIHQLTSSTDLSRGATSLGQGGFQLRHTAMREIPPYRFWDANEPTRVRHPVALRNLVQETLMKYDFVAVAERMDESLVALALLLGVPVTSVLVTASRVSSEHHYHLVRLPNNKVKCLPVVPAYINEGVQDFLNSDQWRAANWGDYVLHRAAYISLDRTIAALGEERFTKALQEFQMWRALEQEQCAPNVQFACSHEGMAQVNAAQQSCYAPYQDIGCGYKCIDELMNEHVSM